MYLYGHCVVGPVPVIGTKSESSIIHAYVIPVLNQSYFTGQLSAVWLHPFISRFTGSDRQRYHKKYLLKKLLLMICAATCVVGVPACMCACVWAYVCVRVLG